MPAKKTSAPRKAPKPRNVAAKALRMGQFQPKVEADPKAYRRRQKHPKETGSERNDPEPEEK
jgi:hypothetical protein